MPKGGVPVQADKDERDLRMVCYGTYGFAGIIGLSALVAAGAFFMASTFESVFFGIIVLVFGLLFAWANVNSARAIAAREDPHLSFFVAGLNATTFFPLGVILSMCTWRVLCRPSVRDIYADPYRAPLLPHKSEKPSRAAATVAGADSATSKIKIVEAAPEAEPASFEAYEDAEEALWREMEKEHKQKKAAEAAEKIKQARDDSAQGKK